MTVEMWPSMRERGGRHLLYAGGQRHLSTPSYVTVRFFVSLLILRIHHADRDSASLLLHSIYTKSQQFAFCFKRRFRTEKNYSGVVMALTMQVVGCSSSFTSGAPLIGVRGSPSPCVRARARSPRSSLVLPGGDECNLSNVDYQDVTSQWISADFLDLRLRSSSLICNEAVQALRKHFEGKDEQQPATASTARQQVVEQAAPSACHVKAPAMPTVVIYDETLFAQL